MRTALALCLLLAGCAEAAGPNVPYQAGSPAVEMPVQNIVRGTGPISVRCRPQPSGLNADCHAL